MISLRILAVAALLALAPTTATAASIADVISMPLPTSTSITSVTLSPDPPIALDPFSLVIEGNFNSSCQAIIGAETPITAPGTVSVDYIYHQSAVVGCNVGASSPFHEAVPIGPLAQGDYNLTVNLYERVGCFSCPDEPTRTLVQVYTDQLTVVPEPSVALLFASGLLGLAIAGKAGR